MTMRIEHTDNIGFMYGTPAAVEHATGTLYINDPLYNKLTPFQQEFVKQHEIGHYRRQTHDEFIADRYAFNKLAGKYKRSLKQSIGTLETILDGDDVEHKKRIDAMYELALQWDAKHGNIAAAKELERLTKTIDVARFSRADGKNKESVQIVDKTGDKMNELVSILYQGQVSQKQVENTGDNTKTLMYMMMALAVLVILRR